MHDMPESTASGLDKDSYSKKTGVRPQDQVAHTPGESGVEAVVTDGANLPASAAQSAEETRRIAHERLGESLGGQG